MSFRTLNNYASVFTIAMVHSESRQISETHRHNILYAIFLFFLYSFTILIPFYYRGRFLDISLI